MNLSRHLLLARSASGVRPHEAALFARGLTRATEGGVKPPHSKRDIARLAAFVLTLAATAVYADSARDAMEQGLNQYEKSDFEKAAESFDKAAQSAGKEKLDPAVPKYNRANTLYRLGRADEAQAAYQEALQTRNLQLQRDTYFNRGNALVAQAEAAEQLQQFQPGVEALEMALAMYENAMMLDPADTDAKVNFELALKKKELLEQMQQQQDQQQQQDNQQKQEQDKQEQQQQSEQQQDQQDQKNEEGQDESEPQDGEPQPEQAQAEPQTSEEMTPEEAEMLLDSMKQDEKARREQLRLFLGKPVAVDKDW
ncbi:MAG: tetratricopeptide repeat protein [Kiritimatiellae bacterium]|nr:tetratricopeptide repeat protein [Kiritimatiellia bacterium]